MPERPSKTSCLPPRLHALLASDRAQFRPARLGAQDAAAVRALLLGEDRGRAGVSIERAMRAVAFADPSEETARALAAVLADAAAGDGARLAAAALLGDIPGETSSNALSSLLGAANAELEFAAVRALAKVGDAKAATAIAALLQPSSEPIKRAGDFARTVIHYRLEARVERSVEQSVMPRGTALPFTAQPAEAIAATIAAIRGSSYGIALNGELGFAFRCAGVRHALLFERGLTRGQLIRDLRARPRIAGIVAMEDRASGHFLARRVVLTRPENEAVAVSVVRPDGVVALYGSARPNGEGLFLQLHSHSERVPTQIDGRITDDGLVLRGRSFRADAVEKRRTEAIVLR